MLSKTPDSFSRIFATLLLMLTTPSEIAVMIPLIAFPMASIGSASDLLNSLKAVTMLARFVPTLSTIPTITSPIVPISPLMLSMIGLISLTISLKDSTIFGRFSATAFTMSWIAGMNGANPSMMVLIAWAIPGACSSRAPMIFVPKSPNAFRMFGRPLSSFPMALTSSPMIFPPASKICGRKSPSLPRMFCSAVPMVVNRLDPSLVSPAIPETRLVIISAPFAMMVGNRSTMPPVSAPTAAIAPSSSCGACSMMLPTRLTIISAPAVISVGSASTIAPPRVVRMSVASGISAGRFSVMAPRIAFRISPPVSISVGRTSLILSEILAMPSLISATPPSESPAKICVSPSITKML